MGALKVRQGGALIETTLSGAVRVGGSSVGFGSGTPGVNRYSLWAGESPTMTEFSDGGASGITTGTLFLTDTPLLATHLRARGWNGATGATAQGALWRLTGQTFGPQVALTPVFNGTPAGPLPTSGFGAVAFEDPVELEVDVPYVLAVWHSQGRYWAGPSGYFDEAHDNGPLHAPATSELVTFDSGGAQAAINGRFLLNSAFALPSDTFNGGVYYADIVAEELAP